MARRPKPWFRKQTRTWYVSLNGKQHNLGRNKREAFKRFYELMHSKSEQRAARHSVAFILDAFLDWTKQHRRPRTFEAYKQALQLFLDHIPPQTDAQELKPYQVQEWVDAHPTWGNTTRHDYITVVQRAFRWAEQMGHLSQSPIRHLEKPPRDRREVIIPVEDYQRLHELTPDQEFKDLLTTSWEVGCRPQESLRVEARHVDLIHGRWIIPPSEAKPGRRAATRPRIVYLSDAGLEITKRRMEQWPEGPLFRNTKQRPWHPYAVNCRFTKLKKSLGRKYCLYSFRHTFCNRLLEAGVDALTVAILLGHSNPAMLSTTYQHLAFNPERLRQQLQSISTGNPQVL